jgi:hypothetical protein
VERNEMETKRMIQRINKTNNHFFEKINYIDNPNTKLAKKKEKIQTRSGTFRVVWP